jgi:hypothetical protein
MDLGSVFAVVMLVAVPAVWIGVPVLLWRRSCRLRELEAEREARQYNGAASLRRGRRAH